MTKEALKLALEGAANYIDALGGDSKKYRQTLAQPEQEPLEYWNAVEGWVKIDEVRQHFDSVGCGTIYKTSGEDRVPIYTTPPQRKPLSDEEIFSLADSLEIWNEDDEEWILDPNTFARAICEIEKPPEGGVQMTREKWVCVYCWTLRATRNAKTKA